MKRPFKKLLVIDAETAWCRKSGYSLSVLTTEEYIRDPRFKCWGFCIREYGTTLKTQWYSHDELPRIFSTYDWTTTAIVAQNSQFDASILEWIYDVHPCFIFDTLSMARAVRGTEIGNSLKKMAQMFNLPDKGEELALSEGYFETLPREIEMKLAGYCMHDVFLCEAIFNKLIAMDTTPYEGIVAGQKLEVPEWSYPTKELRLIDMTMKMYSRPLLELDPNMLTDALHEEKEKREALLERLGVTDKDLSSNDRFAEILRGLGIEPPTKKKKPTVKTPKPTGVNFAFAKTDAMFQAMLNGDNEDVALVCQARLSVKSTTERTRAQRFLDISKRGTLPVPLAYYGAQTGRWTASKGSAINMQNLKRGSFLRKAILAPKGHQLVVGDLSQIEPRVLAWLADYDELLRIFDAGGDPYAMFGAQMFNKPGMTKESAPDLRQSAKSALLGCFGADTPVLTERGWVPIISVQATDTVWDGKEWVCHQGVVPQGEKEVLTAYGVSATSDHEIMTEHGWVEWCEVLASPSLFLSALSSVTLRVSLGNDDRTAQSGKESSATNQKCDVLVDGKALWIEPTYVANAQLGATTVHLKKHKKHEWPQQGMQQSAQTVHIETVYSTASAPSLFVAITRKAQSIQTTVGEVLKSTVLGLKTVLSFCVTWLGLKGGTNQNSSSTAQTTNADTNQTTCDSSHAASIWQTNDALAHVVLKSLKDGLQPLKQKMQTYDIAHAGPRNRYTIMTSHGPIVVHNCGYGLGWASFAAQLLVGFLGAPPVRYDKKFAKELGVTSEDVRKFLEYKDNVKKMEDIPHICTAEELLVHCLASKKIIDKYRHTAQPVVDFWALCGQLIVSSLHEGREYTHKCLTFKKGEIILPSGMSLLYPDLRQEPERDEENKIVKDRFGNPKLNWVYGEDATKLYAGKVVNNVTQGSARCVMTDGMLRVDKTFPVKGTVHDELIAVVPDAEVEAAKPWVLQQMTIVPKYMQGIVLAADGGAHRRYGLAKN